MGGHDRAGFHSVVSFRTKEHTMILNRIIQTTAASLCKAWARLQKENRTAMTNLYTDRETSKMKGEAIA